MLRILHTADWHLGQTFFGYNRTNEHEHFFSWLINELKVRVIDVLIVAGDVFDVSNPSAASQRMFYRFISTVTHEMPALQIIVVAGNHDSAARLEAPTPLLYEMNTTIKGMVRKCDGKIDYDNLLIELRNAQGVNEAICLAVPFLRQGDYPQINTDGNVYAEGVKNLYQSLIAHALALKADNQALIVVGHLQVTGSKIAEKDHSECIIGGLEAVSLEAFSSEVAYTALGHIHKAQHVSGRQNVRYAGSPLPMSFAEKHYRHGVVEVVIKDGKPDTINKVYYTPSILLCSVPEENVDTLPNVLKEIEALPDLPSTEDGGEAPYLEVKVLLDEPEPMLRTQIEAALQSKNVRLARIVTTYRTQETGEEMGDLNSYGLHDMNPLQILQSTFEKTYHSNIPDELLELFNEALLEVNTTSQS